MVDVRAFLLCQKYEIAGDGAFTIVPLEGASAPAFPFVMPSLTAVALLDATEGDVGSERTARIEMERPDGPPVLLTEPHTISFTRSLDGVAVYRGEYALPDLVFEGHGAHWLRFYLDESPVAAVPVFAGLD